jgi:hypothetical protein
MQKRLRELLCEELIVLPYPPNGLKQIKSSRMSWANSGITRHTAGEKRHTWLWWKNLKRRGHVGGVGVEERMLLK